MSSVPTFARVLVAAAALQLVACGTSVTDYTCRDVTESAAKREAMANVIVVQVRARQKVVDAKAVEGTIERKCAGGGGERLAPQDKPYKPVLEATESQAGV